jgi:integrase
MHKEGGPERFRPSSPAINYLDLRDTAATLAFASGATVKEIQRMLGHSNASVTLNRYQGPRVDAGANR